MKKISTPSRVLGRTATCLAALFALGTTTLSAAVTAADLGHIELDKTYVLADYGATMFSSVSATFTAPVSGTIIQEGGELAVYTDADHKSGVAWTFTGDYANGNSYMWEAEAGVTYYLYASFYWGNTTYLKLTMGDQLEIKEVYPAEGSVISPSGNCQMGITFNKPVTFSSVTVATATDTVRAGARAYNSSVFFEPKDLLWNWYSDGKLVAGQEFTVTYAGLAADSVLYGDDGTYTITYVAAPKPVEMLSFTYPEVMKSYFVPGDTAAIVRIVFDGPVAVSGQLKLGYGNTEAGDYYQETVPYTVDGCVVTADLSGHLRRPADMLSSGNAYTEMGISLITMKDTAGYYTWAPTQGALGSYGYTMAYEEIKGDIYHEFTPASGADITGREDVLLYIHDAQLLLFDGFRMEYTSADASEPYTARCPVSDAVADTISDSEVEYTIPLTDAPVNWSSLTITLDNLFALDGIDYSDEITATYVRTTDGITRIETHAADRRAVYNAYGVKVLRETRAADLAPLGGIYIVNGRKQLFR